MVKLKKAIAIVVMVLLVMSLLVGCTEAERVSTNLSQEADNFNVTRQLTVINTRAEDGNNAVLFQMTGNFSINKEADGDLAVIGEEPDGTYYKQDMYRAKKLMEIGVDPYVMEYNKIFEVKRHCFAGWINGYKFKVCKFEEYIPWIKVQNDMQLSLF